MNKLLANSGSRSCNISYSSNAKLLEKAEKIYFLGFGYNDDNLRRLKIAKLSTDIEVKTPTGHSGTQRTIDGTSLGIGDSKMNHIRLVTNGRINLSGNPYDISSFIKEKVDFE